MACLHESLAQFRDSIFERKRMPVNVADAAQVLANLIARIKERQQRI